MLQKQVRPTSHRHGSGAAEVHPTAAPRQTGFGGNRTRAAVLGLRVPAADHRVDVQRSADHDDDGHHRHQRRNAQNWTCLHSGVLKKCKNQLSFIFFSLALILSSSINDNLEASRIL